MGIEPTDDVMDISVSGSSAWEDWIASRRTCGISPETEAALRCGFVAGWNAKEALSDLDENVE